MEQECVEDFIKLSQNLKTPKNGQSRVESIITTNAKRKECEDRAIQIVELLLEGSVRAEFFLKSIVYLNSTYYQDVIEERAITKICGYPLCGRKLKTVSSKRYSISTKNNKVYDLNEYGYFCSIFCFNASSHIKNQIDDSPLWLRKFEDNPTFNLLPKKGGQLGKGVDLKSKITSRVDGGFVPVASFAELSLNDFVQYEDKVNDKSKHFKLSTVLESGESSRLKNLEVKNPKQNLETVIEDDIQEKAHQVHDENEKIINEKQNSVIAFTKNTNSTTDRPRNLGDSDIYHETKFINNTCVEERSSKQRDVICTKKSGQCISNENTKHVGKNLSSLSNNSAKPYSRQEHERMLKKSVNLKELSEKIKNKFNKPMVKLIDPLPLKTESFVVEKSIENKIDKDKTSEFLLMDRSVLELKFSQKNSLEIENQIKNSVRKWITLDTLVFIHGENKIKEVLNANKLSEYFDKFKVAQLEVSQQHKYASICKRLELQEILEQKWDSEFTSLKRFQPVPDFADLKKERKELDIKVKHFLGGMLYEADDSNFPMKETRENEEEGVPVVLPLVDINSQNAVRRRLVLGALNKSVKFFLNAVKCISTSMFSELQDLVKTFKLSADNVVFKPIVSDYLGFICLKILALKECQLRDLLKTKESVQYEHIIFEFLPGKTEVLHYCLNLIENVDIFIENYVISES